MAVTRSLLLGATLAASTAFASPKKCDEDKVTQLALRQGDKAVDAKSLCQELYEIGRPETHSLHFMDNWPGTKTAAHAFCSEDSISNDKVHKHFCQTTHATNIQKRLAGLTTNTSFPPAVDGGVEDLLSAVESAWQEEERIVQVDKDTQAKRKYSDYVAESDKNSAERKAWRAAYTKPTKATSKSAIWIDGDLYHLHDEMKIDGKWCVLTESLGGRFLEARCDGKYYRVELVNGRLRLGERSYPRWSCWAILGSVVLFLILFAIITSCIRARQNRSKKVTAVASSAEKKRLLKKGDRVVAHQEEDV